MEFCNNHDFNKKEISWHTRFLKISLKKKMVKYVMELIFLENTQLLQKAIHFWESILCQVLR